MQSTPSTMRALGVRNKYSNPDGYEYLEAPVPQIKAPDQVLLRMHAAGLFFSDAQHASGSFKIFFKTTFPIILGRSGSGIVVEVGSAVTSFRKGDAVYGVNLRRPMAECFGDGSGGMCAEYAVVPADLLLPKPSHLSFEDAAAGLANIVTAIQFTRECIALRPEAFPHGTLEGKTVLVTAGLGASTSMAAQYAKNVMGAKEVITTVSTAKVPLLDELLPGVFDRAIDYQTQDIVKELGPEKVDFLYNSRTDAMGFVPVMKKETGVIAPILGIPTARYFEEMTGEGVVPWWVKWILSLAQLYYKWKLSGTNVRMKFISGNVGVREDMERAGELLATGQVKSVNTVVSFDDLEDIKASCNQAKTLKGKIGQLVVKII